MHETRSIIFALRLRHGTVFRLWRLEGDPAFVGNSSAALPDVPAGTAGYASGDHLDDVSLCGP